MAVIYLLLGFACLLCKTHAAIPPNFILEVRPICGNDSIEDATIRIITDLAASAKAHCANGVVVDFIDLDGVNFELPVSYPGQGSSECVFWKREDARVYVMKVLAAFGEPGQHIHEKHEEFTVSCVFDPVADVVSNETNIHHGLIAPKVLHSALGSNSTSNYTLELTDVLGVEISGRRVWRSRKVQLKATSDGYGGEVGLRPVGCDAITRSGVRYAVLRAGCGDGIIFNEDDGFITSGLISRSPYFEAFGIEGNAELSFECNFTTCEVICDGSSCVNERKRRGVPDTKASPKGHMIQLHSKPIFLKEISFQSAISHSPPLRVDEIPFENLDTTNALYWTAILGLGLIVVTSLAVSVTACAGFRRVKVLDVNKA